jgi:glycogen operon protein
VPDVAWYQPSGEEMTEQHWEQDDARSLTVFLNGDEIPTHTRKGERLRGDSFLVLLNGHHAAVEFTIPPAELGERWTAELSTGEDPPGDVEPGQQILVGPRSLLVLRRPSVTA